MRSIIRLLVLLGFSVSVLAQESPNVSLEEATLDSKRLPEIVIKRVGDDFSVYLPEYESKDEKIKHMQDAFISYNLGKDYEGYENYLVTMKLDGASLVATYNEKGKLTRVVEKYENVKLPMPVIYSVYKKYPGWKIANDKYLYTQEDGDVLKKEYNLKLTKDKATKKITVNSKGDIIKS